MLFFNLPFPCNCIQMSPTAEAIQNSTTIPRRAPTNYAAYERSFCKLHLFTLQSATTQKSRVHSQAPAAAPLLCSVPWSPPAAAHGYLMGNVSLPWALSRRRMRGCGSCAPAGPAASISPSRRTAAPSSSALPVPLEQGCWHTHLASQQAGGTSDAPLLPTRLAGCSKGVTKVLRWFYSRSRMHGGKIPKRLLKLQITPLWLHFEQSQH